MLKCIRSIFGCGKVFDTYNLAWVSTQHIRASDGKLMDDPDCPAIKSRAPDGRSVTFYILDDGYADQWLDLKMFGFSSEFLTIFDAASANGFNLICFDADGDELDEDLFPIFEW